MVTPPIKDCFFSLDIKIPLFRKECGAAAPPRPGSSIRGRWGIHTCFLSAALRAAPLLSSPKRGSYRPCGAAGALFFRLDSRLASRGRHLRLWRKRLSRRPSGRPGAFFSRERKEAKGRLGNYVSQEPSCITGVIVFALPLESVRSEAGGFHGSGEASIQRRHWQTLPSYTLELPGHFR